MQGPRTRHSLSLIANVGFTGTQDGMTYKQAAAVNRWLERLREHVGSSFHHGDCIGADAAAHAMAKHIGYRIVIHPPTNELKRAFLKADEYMPAAPYLIRNQHIVDASEWMVAAPKQMVEVMRSGTWSTIRYAHKQECPMVICYADGSCTIHHAPGFQAD